MAKADDIKTQVNELVSQGTNIRSRELFANATPEQRATLANKLDEPSKASSNKEPKKKLSAKDKEQVDNLISNLLGPSHFKRDYQGWYSKSIRVVQQVLPDRLAEFKSLYEADRRKQLSLSTYTISDYIAGFYTPDLAGRPSFDTNAVAMGNFETQIEILASALDLLDNYLADMTSTIQSQLLDSELSSARNLYKALHLRSGGVVAGVVLEAHLQSVALTHSVTIRTNATLSTLNDALKNAGVIDIPTWRKLQYMGDIRNKCAHKASSDPSKEEVSDLIDQVEKVIHTVY